MMKLYLFPLLLAWSALIVGCNSGESAADIPDDAETVNLKVSGMT